MYGIDLDNPVGNITKHIRKFQKFLVVCDPYVRELMEDHDWDEDPRLFGDWVQVNWELLVEREILEGHYFLTSFSEGYVENRITSPEETPDYTVAGRSAAPLLDICSNKMVSLDNKKMQFQLFSLVSRDSLGRLSMTAPYDIAYLIESKSRQMVAVDFASLEFYIEKLS